MTSSLIRGIPVLAVLLSICGNVLAQEDPALFESRGNAKVAKAQAYPNRWDGPQTGPVGARKKFIVFIAANLADKGTARVAEGLKEAAGVLDWSVQVVDCYGLPARRAEAFSRALALKPAGIVFAGADAAKESRETGKAAKLKIPVVGWHAAAKAGPSDGLFTNLGADAQEVGQIAGMYAVVDSKARAGVVLLVDSSSAYAVAKAVEIADTIKRCQTCALLSVEEVPINENSAQFQSRVEGLSKKYASRWTHVIATNDQYFDMLANPKADAAAATAHLQGIATGDGSDTAYQRIRAKKIQIGTTPEPLNLQGWQLVDELNRAISGAQPSGYNAPPYLVTNANLAYHGGQKNAFDPNNGYRDMYRKIWLK